MTELRTICQEAHELLLARMTTCSDSIDAWRRIADVVSRRTGACITADVALWVLVEAHLERHQHDPDDPSHLREAIACLGLLAQVVAINRADLAVFRMAQRRAL